MRPATGTTPAGQVTADVTQGATAADRTVAQLVKTIATGPGAIAAGDITSADVTALDTANSSVVGIWVGTSETTCAAALDDLCAAVGAYWGFDNAGKFRIRRLDAPTAAAELTIGTTEIVSIERATSKDRDRGIPTWRVNLAYKRFYQVQRETFDATVTAARRAQLALEYRTTTTSDASVLTAHPLAKELTVQTLLTSSSDAATEASRRLTLYKTRRDMFDITIMLDGSTGADLDIGDIVEFDAGVTRYSLAGRKFVVISVMPDLRRNRIDLTVWG